MEDILISFNKHPKTFLADFFDFMLSLKGVSVNMINTKLGSPEYYIPQEHKKLDSISQAKEYFAKGWSVPFVFITDSQKVYFDIHAVSKTEEDAKKFEDLGDIYFFFIGRYGFKVDNLYFDEYVKQRWIEEAKKKFDIKSVDYC